MALRAFPWAASCRDHPQLRGEPGGVTRAAGPAGWGAQAPGAARGSSAPGAGKDSGRGAEQAGGESLSRTLLSPSRS